MMTTSSYRNYFAERSLRFEEELRNAQEMMSVWSQEAMKMSEQQLKQAKHTGLDDEGTLKIKI
jgi:hypothetical protein